MINVLMVGPARNVKGGMTTVVDNYYKCGLDKKVNLKYIESINDKSKVSKFFKEIIGLLQFKKEVKNCDVIHIHMASRRSTFRKFKYIKIAKKYNKKVIVHIHGAEYKIFYDDECNENKKNQIKKYLSLADKIIVLSEEWEEYFKKIVDKNKLIILYNAIILPNDFNKNINTKKMLFLGELGKRKGIYDLLDVMKRIVSIYPDVKLYVCGNGEIDKVKKYIKDNRLNDNVEFVGWISGNKKDGLLRECSYYILPSYNEGMPMSVLEGMAYKNITISTKVGGIPKVIKNLENGIIVNPGDKNEIYNYLKKLFEDSKLRIKLSKNARSTIEEKFNIEKNVEKLIEIYK